MKSATGWFPAGLALAFGILVLPDPALGHAELTSPPPRSPGAHNPFGPGTPPLGWTCGTALPPPPTLGIASDSCGEPRTSQPTVVTAGSTLEIHWTETINHIGVYEIQFSPAGDTGWLRLKVVADPNNPGGGLFSTLVTLPNTPTTTGTVRVIQWAQVSPPCAFAMLHYSCADLELRPDALFADGFE